MQSPSARKVWIEILRLSIQFTLNQCHLPRGRCGLKYLKAPDSIGTASVTFRAEGVDWNLCGDNKTGWMIVTFREEGVDWNPHSPKSMLCALVTFREEGVDWNFWIMTNYSRRAKSPSARKVWIEMTCRHCTRWSVYRHLPRGRCGLKFRWMLM